MNASDFKKNFLDLHHLAVARYAAGHRDPATLLTPAQNTWLITNGLTPQNIYDYAEDFNNYDGTPTAETAAEIESIRHDYFITVQNGIPSKTILNPDTLPAKTDSINGIEWLPRILPKALAKLRGELPSTLMYCCGGDRRFFATHNLTAPQFLSLIRQNETDFTPIITLLSQPQK